MINDVDHFIKERNIVGDQDEGVFVIQKITFQPGNVLLVQIVGRLVQKKDIRFLQKQLGKEDLGTLSAA